MTRTIYIITITIANSMQLELTRQKGYMVESRTSASLAEALYGRLSTIYPFCGVSSSELELRGSHITP
jgi:hypothetical protein